MSVIISGSEGETFSTCERSHYYKFALGLQPKQENIYIRIGVAGHKALETFYRCALESNNDLSAMKVAVYEELGRMADKANDEEDFETISLISSRMGKYMDLYSGDGWRVIDVEGRYIHKLTDDIDYGMTLDLLVECTKGPLRGQCLVVDHKFCYNFFTPDEVEMNSQLPKYIVVLKQLGFNVRRGVLNQVRYRGDIKDGAKLFRRALIEPTTQRLEAIMDEQQKVSELIFQNLSKPVSTYRDEARRAMSKRNCGNCSFRKPCSMELDGRDHDASRLLAIHFKENTYGYRG